MTNGGNHQEPMRLGLLLLTAIVLLIGARVAPACVGDCSGDGSVHVDEVLTLVTLTVTA